MFGLRFKVRDFVYMFIAGIFVLTVFAIVNHSLSTDEINVDDNHPESQKVLHPIDGDFIIGEKDAPIRVVFYGDFTCHHCMRFMKETFLKLRDDYIFTKKIKFIFRPVISLKRSLYGAKFLFCDQRDDVVNSKILWEMFEKKWMLSNDYLNKLSDLVVKNNWTTKEHFVECMNSKEIHDNLHNIYENTVKKLNIHETPHIFVNYLEATPNTSIFSMIDKEYYKYQKQHKK